MKQKYHPIPLFNFILTINTLYNINKEITGKCRYINKNVINVIKRLLR